ncbi:MAG: HlyC/CorC family transporter [Acidaminococcaceae bacterium]|nr:HlyC/CorC family transporter [Acidaminococcaceae bacterium]
MQERGVSGAETLLRIFDRKNHYISALQIGITCISLLLGWYGGPLLANWLLRLPGVQQWLTASVQLEQYPVFSWLPDTASSLSLLCAFLILLLLHVVIGELVPRIIVWDKVEEVILHLVTPLRVVYLLTCPLVGVAFWIAKGIAKLFGVTYTQEEDISRSEEELRQIVSASEKEGELDSGESVLIDNVLGFNDTVAREVMVPRQDMVCLYVDDSLEEIRDVIRSSHHTRFPVCEEDKDHILGIFHVRDFLNGDFSKKFDIRSVLRKTIMVPEGMNALRVLQAMQKQRVHLAVVVDEYGGTAGLVTLEDLLEEIVGDMGDEYEPAELPDIMQLANGTYDIDGEMPLDDVSDLLNLSFDEEDEDDTLGGYIFSRLGRKPEEGDEIEWKNWTFTVLKMDQFRIERVKAEKTEAE